MFTTKVLEDAVGIQWQGLTDKTVTVSDGVGNPLIVGEFKRGRTDKVMTVHAGNIRSVLGYEPENPDYMAVEDMLDEGVPVVNVLRLAVAKGTSSSISCAGATPYVIMSIAQLFERDRYDYAMGLTFNIKINDKEYNNIPVMDIVGGSGLGDTAFSREELKPQNIVLFPDSSGNLYVFKGGNETVKVSVTINNYTDGITVSDRNKNPTLKMSGNTMQFCLIGNGINIFDERGYTTREFSSYIQSELGFD